MVIGFAEILSILFLVFVFYALGFRIVRKRTTDIEPDEPEPETETDNLADRRALLIRALGERPFTEVLSDEQRQRLHRAILHPDEPIEEPTPGHDYDFSSTSDATDDHPESAPESQPEPDYSFLYSDERSDQTETNDYEFEAASGFQYEPEPTAEHVEPVKTPVAPPRKPVMETIRASWDPAVMMLYLGALLVVVAGLIFATYNWGDLGAWQKLGMLAGGTAAFLIAGFAIRNMDRVKPASTTFLVIGGLLVPANFLAAYTVFDDVQPALPLLLGAIATTVIHGLLSYQPGASLFRYSAVGAAIVAIASIPAAFGFPAGWGGVLGLVVIAMLPDSVFGTTRFRKAWHVVSRSAAGLLAGFALWQGLGEHGWIVAGALIGVSMVATRFSARYPAMQLYLRLVSDIALIAASVQIARNFDGDRWMIAAGFLALTLVLVQESRRYKAHAGRLEFAAAITVAFLAGEIVGVLGTDPWAVAIALIVLAGSMLLHATRHQEMAPASEAIAAFALPLAVGAAMFAIEPSLWNLTGGLAALTATMLLLGLHRNYAQNWPGFVASAAGVLALLAVVPSIGPDVGWACVGVLFLIAVAPFPFGRLFRFGEPWRLVSNGFVLPIAALGFWRGTESNEWMIPLLFLALSMWLTRKALEGEAERTSMLNLADLMAVLAGVSFASVLDGDRWLLAAGLLGVTLVLIRRSFTWPSVGAILQFGAAISFAMFAGEVANELVDDRWIVSVAMTTLAVGMLVHSRLHPRHSWISEMVAVWAIPAAIGTGILATNESWWSLPISSAALTLLLIVHRVRHRHPGDLNLAIASLSGIFAVITASIQLDLWDEERYIVTMFVLLAILLTAIANAFLPRFASVSGWLKNLIRLETLPILAFAALVDDFDNAPVFVVAILAMFWNVWSSRNAFWTLPMAGAMWVSMIEILVPSGASANAHLWWYLALAAAYTAIAWQLDRKANNLDDHLHPGFYLWIGTVLISALFLMSGFYQLANGDAGFQTGLVMLLASVLVAIGFLSTGFSGLLVPVGLLLGSANLVWILGDLADIEHGILAVAAFALAAVVYLRFRTLVVWAGYVFAILGLTYTQLALDFDYSRDVLIGLILAWVLMSLAIARWNDASKRFSASIIVLQAVVLHPVAIILPLLEHNIRAMARPDLVLILVSLAGMVATYGSLKRSREIVLIGSGIGMSALMLQINIGSPGNIHVYTVPLSIYLLGVGLLMRRDPRIANTMLAVGSAMLVVPALIEALTTGEIVWLWVALAESLGLFLFGTILRLRIPTAAGVIAVSVIVLRMLVFAVSVMASWVSILAIGVSLLLIGTMWLIFREAIQAKAQALFARWRGFD